MLGNDLLLRPVAPLRRRSAGTAESSSRTGGSPVNALVMSVLADGDASPEESPSSVLRLGDRFHVVGVLAEPVAAKMVDHHAVRDRADSAFPSEAVGTDVPPVNGELAVPVRVPSAHPDPAVALVDLYAAPEVLGAGLQGDMGWLDAETVAAGSGDPLVPAERPAEGAFEDRSLRVPADSIDVLDWLPCADSTRPDQTIIHIEMIPPALFALMRAELEREE